MWVYVYRYAYCIQCTHTLFSIIGKVYMYGAFIWQWLTVYYYTHYTEAIIHVACFLKRNNSVMGWNKYFYSNLDDNFDQLYV